jgi:transporter family protein
VTYITWALASMLTYGVMAIFLKTALQTIRPEAAVVVTNGMLALAGVVWAASRGIFIPSQLGWTLPTLALVVAGLLLSFSIITYYKALSLGPLSVVLPIFAMQFAVAAALGMVFLDEPVRVTKLLGLLFAGAAILLLTR